MMPIRQANADNKQQIYRSFEIGKLLKLIMLDTRIIGRDIQNITDASVSSQILFIEVRRERASIIA